MLGLYVHIPFCLQRCRYCDFATYAADQVAVNSAYVDTLLKEIKLRKTVFSEKQLGTVYFGGGTPSLLPATDIQRILGCLKDEGFSFLPDCEITIEINPATVTPEKLSAYLASGVNRMSVGVQTFADHHLQNCGRRHSADDTRDTLELLREYKTNFSMDLLFALPNQTMTEIKRDLEIFKEFRPNHISPYCLTVPEMHPMNTNRPDDEIQRTMFEEIWRNLEAAGYERYEISNFALPGHASKHNNLYWTDKAYWGIGLSAHSYRPSPEWGYRFWNPADYKAYMKHIENLGTQTAEISQNYLNGHWEKLACHQSLTDYCHTALRLRSGLNKGLLRQKYGIAISETARQRLTPLVDSGLVLADEQRWTLSDNGVLLSNQVFSQMLFSSEDIDKLA